MDLPVIYTVGHSTRSLDTLVGLLREAGVHALIDVRRIPRSRRHPQFAADQLSGSLPACGIAYAHEPALGGFRRPRIDSPNHGWRQPAFVGYADHMASAEFQTALDRAQGSARGHALCLMCAEAQWWRCHRRLISDALVVRGWRVLHLGLGSVPVLHELTPFAVVGDHCSLTYPPAPVARDASQLALGQDSQLALGCESQPGSGPDSQLAFRREV
jgi:uncharacterized protein (DUF488 family)